MNFAVLLLKVFFPDFPETKDSFLIIIFLLLHAFNNILIFIASHIVKQLSVIFLISVSNLEA